MKYFYVLTIGLFNVLSYGLEQTAPPPVSVVLNVVIICTTLPLSLSPGMEGLYLPRYHPRLFDEALSSGKQYKYGNHVCYILIGHEPQATIPALVRTIFEQVYGKVTQLSTLGTASVSTQSSVPDTYELQFSIICTQDSNFVHNVDLFVPGGQVMHAYHDPTQQGTCYVVAKTKDLRRENPMLITSDMINTAVQYLKFFLSPDLP